MERVVEALAGLAAIAEPITDEWTYVNDLATVWSARLRAVAVAHAEPAATDVVAAIDALVAEASRITDPHRAIDWMSTLPQATLVALGEEAW